MSITPKRVEIWAKGQQFSENLFLRLSYILYFSRATLQKINLVIIEQLFLAKLSLTSFLNQLNYSFVFNQLLVVVNFDKQL